MEYRVVEVKWSRGGNFYGTPPIRQDQTELTEVFAEFDREGWTVADIHHEVGDSLRFSIITLTKGA